MLGHSPAMRFMKLCVAFALVIAVTSSSGFANPRVEEGLGFPERFGPVGCVFSLGTVLVDNRAVTGEFALWGGERLWARDASANVRLHGVGRATLFTGGVASLTTSVVDDTGAEGASILIIVVQAGQAAISLEAGASARVEASGSRFRASPGSKFTVRIEDGESIFGVALGVVTKEPGQSQPDYTLIGAEFDKNTGWRKSYRTKYRVEVKKEVQIPVMAEPKLRPVNRPPRPPRVNLMLAANQSVPSTQPAVGVEVRFCITTTPPLGYLEQPGGICETVRTDQNGVASVIFRAGPDNGPTAISATVPGGGRWDVEIEVFKPAGLLRPRNIAILAAAAVATICIFKCNPDPDPGPLRQVPPPIIP